jgi:hypothetical protein
MRPLHSYGAAGRGGRIRRSLSHARARHQSGERRPTAVLGRSIGFRPSALAPTSLRSSPRSVRLEFTLDTLGIKAYKLPTLLNEGRQPVTPVDGAGCGACRSAFVTHAAGTLWVGRPAPLRGSAGSPAGRWPGRMRAKACGIGVGAAHPARPGRTAPERKVAALMRREAGRVSEMAGGVSGMPCVFRRIIPLTCLHATGAPAPAKQQGCSGAPAPDRPAEIAVSVRQSFPSRSVRRSAGRSCGSMRPQPTTTPRVRQRRQSAPQMKAWLQLPPRGPSVPRLP